MFTLTVSADELEFLRAAVAAVKHETEHPTVVATLGKAKPVRAARKPAAPRKAAIKWQSPGLPPLKRMKVSEQDAAERAWNAECERAREAVAAGKPSAAEETLRHLIALHYPAAATS